MLARVASLLAFSIVLAGSASAGTAADAAFQAQIARAKAAMMSNPQAALSAAENALAQARQAPGDHAIPIATAQWLQGEALWRVGHPQRAAPILSSALSVVSRLQPRGALRGDLLMSLGNVDSLLGKVESALEDYQQAFEIYRLANDPRGQARALQDIGSIYQDSGDYERELKYYQESAAIYKGDPNLLISAINNKGEAYKSLGRLGDSIAAFKSALALARNMHGPSLEAEILANLASAEVKAGRLSDAQAHVQRGLLLAAGSAPEQRPFLCGLAAEIALKRGELKAASGWLAQTFAGVDLSATTMPYRDFHEVAWRTYHALGDDRLALEHLQAVKRLDDEATKATATANAALMAARFDFANQDLKIAKLKAGQLQRDVQLARQRNTIVTGMLVGSGLVLVLLAGGFVSIRRSRNAVRKANVSLTETNVALEKALKAKGDFLATTSHEIRTPLNGILGMTQVLLNDRRLDEEVKDKIALVHGAGETMRALVDDILDLAKMENGGLTIVRSELDLRAMLEEASRLWAEKARAKGLKLELEIEAGLDRIVEDGGRLRQIVFNLMSNAIKFTDAGRVRLHARAEGTGQGERLVISVSDTGVGIPEDKHQTIFESFSQVDTSVTRQYGGTGLGLAICWRLLQVMGGSIGVHSRPGEGATFTVDLPLERLAAAAAPRREAEGPEPRAADLSQARLLILEANPLVQSVLRTSLAGKVGQIEVSAAPADALAAVRRQRFDQILADGAALGGADEEVALGRLAELADLASCPVIVTWAAPSEQLCARLEAAGAQRVLAKPIKAAALIEALRASFADADAPGGSASAQSMAPGTSAPSPATSAWG